MTDEDAARDRSDRPGATTSGKGTPAPVDVSGSRPGHIAIALFLAAPVIWSVHFMLVYLVVEAGCSGGGAGLNVFSPPVPTAVTLWATIVAALACAGCAAWCYRLWRREHAERVTDATASRPPHDGRALLFGGFLLSVLGVITVLVVGLPALALPACLP